MQGGNTQYVQGGNAVYGTSSTFQPVGGYQTETYEYAPQGYQTTYTTGGQGTTYTTGGQGAGYTTQTYVTGGSGVRGARQETSNLGY